MNILWFLLGVVTTFIVEFAIALIIAIKDMEDRKKYFEETMEMLNEIQVKTAEEEMKPKKATTKKTTKTKKGE